MRKQYVVRTFNKEWSSQQNLLEVMMMKQWNVTKLQICGSQRESVIKDICHISFPRLTKLVLVRNDIGSLEKLIFIDMVNLNQLHLFLNKLGKVKILRKGYWPQLESLQTHGNLMIEGEGLSEMNFCLKDISIEYWNDLSINDARFMMKMEAKYLQAIIFTDNRKKLQPYIERIAIKKWQNTLFKWPTGIYL